jgi:hypothetical protein
MRFNTRYFYTILFSGIGIWSIKYLYFNIRKKNELDFNNEDYFLIGGFSGIFFANFFILLNLRNLISSFSLGGLYGLIYKFIMIYIINKNKRNAEKIGIKF